MPAGVCEAAAAVRARCRSTELVAPAAELARDGVRSPRAGLHDRDPRRDRHLDARVRRAVRPRRPAARRGRRGCASPSWPTRSSGSAPRAREPSTPGTSAAAIARLGGRARRDAHRADLAAYRVVDREPVSVATAGREVLTNPPPSAGGILIARALALLERTAGPPTADRRWSRRWSAPRPSAPPSSWPGSTTRIRRASCRAGGVCARAAASAARLDHPHLGARPRGLGVLGDLLERLVLRRRRARDRRPPEQHARRAGPQPARLSPPPAGAPAAEHDGADGRAARRRGPSWCSAAPAPTGSARRSCRRSCA